MLAVAHQEITPRRAEAVFGEELVTADLIEFVQRTKHGIGRSQVRKRQFTPPGWRGDYPSRSVLVTRSCRTTQQQLQAMSRTTCYDPARHGPMLRPEWNGTAIKAGDLFTVREEWDGSVLTPECQCVVVDA